MSAGICYRCGDDAERLFADAACWTCTEAAEYDPTPAGVNGPCSNTGQNALIPKRIGARTKPRANIKKGAPGTGALIDYLSLTIADASSLLREFGEDDFAAKIAAIVFGRDCSIAASDFTGNGFQGYTNSAMLIAPTGEIVGRVGCGGNNDTVHLSISGNGCAQVEDWQRVATAILTLGAKITRCDLAFDDYDGLHFSPQAMHEAIEAGVLGIRARGAGKPPKTRYLTDHGHKTGCTLYAGRKGHKELCIYEKGRQLGDLASDWVRCEVRFWAKRANLPVDMLLNPLAYLRGAYNVCERIPANVTEKVKTVAKKIEATAVAWTRWMQTQAGQSLGLLKRVLGEDADAFISAAIARPGVPGRFKGFTAEHLTQFIRQGLGHVDRCNPVGALA